MWWQAHQPAEPAPPEDEAKFFGELPGGAWRGPGAGAGLVRAWCGLQDRSCGAGLAFRSPAGCVTT